MDLRPQCPCDWQMLSGIQDKLSLFQGCHLVHIDDTVPVAAYELGIAEQQAGKTSERPAASGNRYRRKKRRSKFRNRQEDAGNNGDGQTDNNG